MAYYSTKRDPAYSFGMKTVAKHDFSNPGPGNYKPVDPSVYKEAGPKYSIKGSGGHDFSVGNKDMPGPGQYS
jgi:hypothetical protein